MLALLLALALGEPVTFGALLEELGDRVALARLPDPSWTPRIAVGPYLRVEERAGRTERVLLDAEGPGAVVRISAGVAPGRVRVYLDGDSVPVLDEPLEALLADHGLVPRPPAAHAGAVGTCRLPIPFARRCVVTSDADAALVIEHRAYPAGTPCATLRRADLATHAAELADALRRMRAPPPAGEEAFAFTLSSDHPEGDLLATAPGTSGGPRAVSSIELRVLCDGPVEDALRRLIVHARFDGEETVRCPLGDFFAAAPDGEPDAPLLAPAPPGPAYVARWILPYRERFELGIDARGVAGAHVAGAVHTIPWTWDERSLRFHARRLEERDAAQLEEALSAPGAGRFVGEVVGPGESSAEGRAGAPATRFWYARPGSRAGGAPVAAQALDTVLRIPGALEAEALRVAGGDARHERAEQTAEEAARAQAGAWSGRGLLRASAETPGAFVELEVPVAKPGRRGVLVYFVPADDGARVRFSVDGQVVEPPIDTFAPVPGRASGPRGHALGEFELGPVARLRAELCGPDTRSSARTFALGLDAVVLR